MYLGFPRELIAALRCLSDAAPLHYDGELKHIENTTLRCSQCDREVLIRDGIVLLVESERIPMHLEREMHVRNADAPTYDAHLAERYYREMPTTLAEIGSLTGKMVIEYGAGTGRFTEKLSQQAAFFLASDISLTSLHVLAGKNISDTVGLVCSDATAFRTADSFFDVALALQVIEHMPTPLIRERFYQSIRSTLKQGGVFVASVYHQDLRRIMSGKPVDGTHPNGIPFHFFSVGQFKMELGKFFDGVRARPIDITFPFEGRLHFSQRAQGIISSIGEHIPLLNRFGHLVLAKAYKSLP